MKSKSCCAMVFILIGNIIFAQESDPKISAKNSEYWNLSYSVGFAGNIKTNGFDNGSKNGYNYSIDASYTPESIIGFFVNYSSTDFKGDVFTHTHYTYPYSQIEKFNYSEFTFGPRFYSKNKKLFADAGIGYYSIQKRRSIGLNAGIGGKIKFSDSYGLVIQGRIHNAFVDKETFIYYGLYTGLEINSSKKASPIDYNTKSKISVAVLIGTNPYYDRYSKRNVTFGGEFSYDVEKRVSLIANYFFSDKGNSYYYLTPYYIPLPQNEHDFSGGARFYFGENNLKLFLESLVALNITSSSYQLQTFDPDYVNAYSYKLTFGLNFGTGAEFKIINDLSGLIKANVFTQFRDGYYSALYGGLKYRL